MVSSTKSYDNSQYVKPFQVDFCNGNEDHMEVIKILFGYCRSKVKDLWYSIEILPSAFKSSTGSV